MEACALQHNHKDGRLVNEAVQQIIEQGENLVADCAVTMNVDDENHVTLENEVYDKLVGVDRYGRIREYRLEVVWADLNGVHASFGLSQETEDKLRQMEAQIAGMQDYIGAEVRAEFEAERRVNIQLEDQAAIRAEVRDEVVAVLREEMQGVVARMLAIYGIGPPAATSKRKFFLLIYTYWSKY